MNFDYYYGDESNQFAFYRIPRQLITGEAFKKLSTDAKLCSRPGAGGRSTKKSRPPRSARALLTTAREWLDSQADEEYGYEDDGDY